MWIFLPISLQLHRTPAEIESSVRHAIGIGHHWETSRVKRIVTGVRPRRPKNILAAPTKIADGTASAGIQCELRCLVTQHQKILVDSHRAVWRGSQPAAGSLIAAEARVLPRVQRL